VHPPLPTHTKTNNGGLAQKTGRSVLFFLFIFLSPGLYFFCVCGPGQENIKRNEKERLNGQHAQKINARVAITFLGIGLFILSPVQTFITDEPLRGSRMLGLDMRERKALTRQHSFS
jgi:hypothetical protein